jgi:dipeptidyl aminopeptidase/acylaminoacyl peptidase
MPARKSSLGALLVLLNVMVVLPAVAAEKPVPTFDEFFNSVSFDAVRLSPDGRAIVVATNRADWEHDLHRHDLWLYRDDGKGGGTLIPLTQSGRDSDPQWSPDGRWVAFLSDRKGHGGKDGDSDEAKEKEISQLYLISADGGEAFPVTEGEEEIHAFAWSPDSRALYFATRIPWTKAQKDAYKKDWKDVLQYRKAERGDLISSVAVADAVARRAAAGTKPAAEPADSDTGATPGAHPVARTPWRVNSLAVSADGKKLAFASGSTSERIERIADYEVYVVDLVAADPERPPRQVTRNEAVEQDLRWAADNRHVLFRVDLGSVEGKYKDTQTRLYWVDSENGEVQRWAKEFGGPVNGYSLASDGSVTAEGRLGTEVQLYTQANPGAAFRQLPGAAGTYESLATSKGSPRLAFVHSALDRPTEVYLAESLDKLPQARPITAFNKLFTERELPKGKPYRWKADDGSAVEGMLLYPPGKFEAKNLPMLVLIHGGPADADGNHFEVDWYQWSAIAASQGWLVFQPNYRGSSGYGDKFLMEIVPQLVSRPGKDILEGVDALVKDGIANPDRLAISGYSYGGYMTNWLITQTTRFKAAMTGAGAVEHAANWGNDDLTLDDAYYLGGQPWEAQPRYHDEAALFQINQVATPTHMVAGADDIRVAVLEDYLLDHALYALGIPSTLLIFPGEGHSLRKNPWHGKIKVREELKWLEKYAGVPAGK